MQWRRAEVLPSSGTVLQQSASLDIFDELGGVTGHISRGLPGGPSLAVLIKLVEDLAGIVRVRIAHRSPVLVPSVPVMVAVGGIVVHDSQTMSSLEVLKSFSVEDGLEAMRCASASRGERCCPDA